MVFLEDSMEIIASVMELAGRGRRCCSHKAAQLRANAAGDLVLLLPEMGAIIPSLFSISPLE